jgi:hypothetical protein
MPNNETNETERTITLIPNYAHLFRTMLQDASIQGAALRMFDGRADRVELLRETQRWFAPLTIAANCATTVPAIEELRSAMSEMLANLDKEAQRLEQAAWDTEEARRMPEGWKGLL